MTRVPRFGRLLATLAMIALAGTALAQT